jgi:hypothetical protein
MVQSDAASPYSTLLMSATSRSSSLHLMMDSTGPKISSLNFFPEFLP